MNEDEKSNTIKSEWALLMNSFIDENDKTDIKIKNISNPAIYNGDDAKALSLMKHQLHQQIEVIKSQIEETSQIIENLKLVGSDTDYLNTYLDDLNKQGETVSLQIHEIDQKIKKMRRPDRSA